MIYLFDEKLFRIKLIERDVNLTKISEVLNINLVTLYRKMNGLSDFYRDEIQKICDFLNLDLEEREDIFFSKKIT